MFVGLDDSDLEKIASLSSWQRNTYGAGESVFRENDVAKDFYILEEGEVRLVVASRKGRGTKEPVRVSVDTITKGDVFGWSSLVAPHSRNMSAVCVRPSTILSITGAELNHLMDHNHSLGYEVMKSLVRVIGKRLRDLQNKFAGE
ncbi:MAG: cyclic nucleotide-binding domain-containing protein [Dehalococcoidales bacterium]|nr:cyclic nucleotide-binding domain-containing protein [Dehalococcoidales bacterium]